MKEYIAPLLRFGALILLLTTIYEQNNAINEYKAKASVNVDSLQTELFVKQTEVGRYQMALETFKEEDSVAADHFEYILSNKTE
jgi:hypothetical protein